MKWTGLQEFCNLKVTRMTTTLSRLMRKQTMNYETTLLCVILREMLEEFDIKSEGTKLFLTQKEIKERIEFFIKSKPIEASFGVSWPNR